MRTDTHGKSGRSEGDAGPMDSVQSGYVRTSEGSASGEGRTAREEARGVCPVGDEAYPTGQWEHVRGAIPVLQWIQYEARGMDEINIIQKKAHFRPY